MGGINVMKDSCDPSYYSVHLGRARKASMSSRDLSTHVGAYIPGFGCETNNFPDGVSENPERRERPEKYLWTAHAEESLIVRAAREKLAGTTMYITHFCCATCARMIIGAGIKRIVVDNGKTSMPEEQFTAAETMLREAGVEIVRV
jgi:dCMP deaminase